MRTRYILLGVFIALTALPFLATPAAGATMFFPLFQLRWKQTDLAPDLPPVWGPSPFSETLQERYAGADPDGYRLVQYFDKGRMELGPNGTVTAGLLATELLNGKEQVGDTETRL